MAIAERPNVVEHMPPASIESEHAVLGSLLQDAEAIWKVRSDLHAEDFWDGDNAEVYRAAVALCDRGEPVDSLTIAETLKARGTLDSVGGRQFLSDLWGAVPTALQVSHYAERVIAAALRRRLIQVNGQIAALAYDETVPLEQVRARAWSLMTGIDCQRERTKILTPDDQGALFWDMLSEIEQDTHTTIRTGIADLDRITDGGLDRGQLVVLMALPGMGKSALAQGIGRFMGSHGYRALFCSVEMNERQLVRRNAAALLGMDWHAFRRAWKRQGWEGGSELRAAVMAAHKQMVAGKMHLWYRPAMTTADVRVKALEMKSSGGLDCVIVDYLQILADGEGDRDNRNQQVGLMCRTLKRIAGELDVPVLVLSQMSRDYKTRDDKRPVMSDGRDSGEIEQHADMLLGLYRDDFFYKGFGVKNERGQMVVPGTAEVLVLKQREGPPGTCYLRWQPATCTFESPADAEGRAE